MGCAALWPLVLHFTTSQLTVHLSKTPHHARKSQIQKAARRPQAGSPLEPHAAHGQQLDGLRRHHHARRRLGLGGQRGQVAKALARDAARAG